MFYITQSAKACAWKERLQPMIKKKLNFSAGHLVLNFKIRASTKHC